MNKTGTFNIIVELSRMQGQAIDRVLAGMDSNEQKPKESKDLVD
jgi:hypothetical protein